MKLQAIQIETTSYCAANCIMCPHHDYEFRNKIMSLDLFKKIVDDCVSMGITIFIVNGMGDAFLDPHLVEKLRYIKKTCPNSTIKITAIGYAIDFDALNYIDVLTFSNYGFTKETFEAVHGIANYEIVRDNIKRVLKLPDGVRPYIHIQYLLLKENEHEMDEWKQYWSNQENIDEIWIWKPVSWTGLYEQETTEHEVNYSQSIPCFRVFDLVLQVKANGLVSVCCYDIRNTIILGNLNTNSLNGIITNNNKLIRLQEVHKNKAFASCEFESCKKCDQTGNREHALIYSSQGRKTGAIALQQDKEFRFAP
jgi:MoaA/NifB/PqqE/SkfB family radical SAM enzyme